MPYEGEFAEYRSIHRITESTHVQRLLERAREREVGSDKQQLTMLSQKHIASNKWQPELVLAIDGSHQPVLVEKGYPGAEIGYVTVASVLMDVAKIRELDKQRPSDPRVFRTAEQAGSIDCAFPGCNIVIDNEGSSIASLRKALFEVFNETRMFSDGETLLDTFEALMEHRALGTYKCPYGDDCMSSQRELPVRKGMYDCNCLGQKKLYSTDALRIHEGMVPDSTNGAMFAEIMQTIERVLMIHILRWMEQKNLLWLLQNMAIIMDGPLAIFGHPAGLLQAIIKELRRINQISKEFTDGEGILLIGIEKTGTFVNHFLRIDQNNNGTQGEFLPQTVALLTDDYIKKNIVFSDSKKRYGEETYFGRKLFYKTASGAQIVATLPMLID